MRAVKVYCTLGVIWMTAAIIYGFVIGDFFGEARVLFHFPWFQISMADLYTGLSLFSGWVIFRERSAAVSVGWIIVFVLLGNPATCGYALLAAIRSKGDWQAFWMGKNQPAR